MNQKSLNKFHETFTSNENHENDEKERNEKEQRISK